MGPGWVIILMSSRASKLMFASPKRILIFGSVKPFAMRNCLDRCRRRLHVARRKQDHLAADVIAIEWAMPFEAPGIGGNMSVETSGGRSADTIRTWHLLEFQPLGHASSLAVVLI